MQTQPGVETCLNFITSQALHAPPPPGANPVTRPLSITISRQTGSGAHCIATALARHLQARNPHDASPWTVFDRDLVEVVLKDHNLPVRLARFMPEDRVPEIADTLDELFGVHPPVHTLIQQTAETILHLANRGNAILIGRGAHVVTSRLDHVFHVRLVGSLERRIAHLYETRGLDRAGALALIRREDRGRQRYLKKYFGKDIDDALSYDLVLNTDSLPYEHAARLIADAAFENLRGQEGYGNSKAR